MPPLDGFLSQQIVAVNTESVSTINTQGNSKIKHKYYRSERSQSF